MKYILLTTTTLIAFIFAAIIINSCKEDLPEVPIGENNKIELTLTTDSVSYTYAKLQVGLNYIPEYSNYEAGICYDTLEQPNIDDKKITISEIKALKENTDAISLLPNTKYYCRAYFKVNDDVAYSTQVNWITLDARPIIESQEIAEISALSAKITISVLTPAGFDITERGVCWNTTENPDLDNQVKTVGNGAGKFTADLTGLEISKKYYFRAYAKNSAGTTYGVQQMLTTLDGKAVITTASVHSIAATKATSGGNITSDGGFKITERGVAWGTSNDVKRANNVTLDGSGMGVFSSYLTGLTVNTSYYVWAYATNSIGTVYGNMQTFITQDGLPQLTTVAITNVTVNSATSGGIVTQSGGDIITAQGICWATTTNPTIANNKTIDGEDGGTYASNLTGLSPNTTYYVRAYATNSIATAYGDELTITTLSGIPQLTTVAISTITTTTATSGGAIASDGGAIITARGVCWGTTTSPTIANSKTTDGTDIGSFTSSLTGLTINTTYYVRAFATNSVGTVYGNEQSFTTLDGTAVLTTSDITAITGTTATAGGNITSDGGVAITARGVCWATNTNPTMANSMTTDGTGTGSFTSSLAGLTINTTYYVRAYATNSVGTKYGNEQTFTTLSGIPVLTTNEITAISGTSALAGGNITSDGGVAITARGLCWSTTTDPTIANSKTVDGTGTGSFTSSLTGLTINTTYYVRAYATNSMGTVYGNEVSFIAVVAPIGTVTSPTTGKVWMDRNLGATQVATSSTDAAAYGDLYQWGRGTDGHEKRNSATTDTLSSSNAPGNGNFILANIPYDWRSPQNNNLWQGASGVNNPCPTGFRVPTEAELDAERASWSSNNAAGAFSSPLKFSVAGNRTGFNGLLDGVGSAGLYWSNTVGGYTGRSLAFDTGNAYMSGGNRANGFSVRCIKD